MFLGLIFRHMQYLDDYLVGELVALEMRREVCLLLRKGGKKGRRQGCWNHLKAWGRNLREEKGQCTPPAMEGPRVGKEQR